MDQIYQYWDYYLLLESDLIRASRYVEISENNFNTYSIEFAHLLFASCSEFENVAKKICSLIDSSKDFSEEGNKTIRDTILSKFPKLTEMRPTIPRNHLLLDPWAEWRSDEIPFWWDNYNKVKHNRDDHFEEANLKNVLYSLAGLFCGALYLYRIIEDSPVILYNEPKLLEPGKIKLYGMEEATLSMDYSLPDDFDGVEFKKVDRYSIT